MSVPNRDVDTLCLHTSAAFYWQTGGTTLSGRTKKKRCPFLMPRARSEKRKKKSNAIATAVSFFCHGTLFLLPKAHRKIGAALVFRKETVRLLFNHQMYAEKVSDPLSDYPVGESHVLPQHFKQGPRSVD